MKKFLALFMSLAMLLALASCQSEEKAPQEESKSEVIEENEEKPENIPGGNTQLANPYVTYENKEAMQEGAGFEVSLPEELSSWAEETIYRAIPGELAEVIYKNSENEIRVRIAYGNEDISGVYDSDTKETKETEINGNTISLKGETNDDGKFNVFVSTWVSDERTYSVTSTLGVIEEDLVKILEFVK